MNVLTALLSRLAPGPETPVPAREPGRPAAVAAPSRTVTLSVERVRQIRHRAEQAALAFAMGDASADGNPYRSGTRQHVLWTTSFHAKLMEFETEAFAPAPVVPGLQ